MSNKIQKIETQEITPMQLISDAQANGADVEKLHQLFELQLRWENNEAKKAYNEAMAEFKAETFVMNKDGWASFKTKNGGEMSYSFITLANVVHSVVPLLSSHGLSHSWETKQDGSTVHVRCRISHRKGHSESISLCSGLDTSGMKNNIQMIGSTVSYLQRYTLMSILGLASADIDNDGNDTSGPPVERITESQAADIYALISELKVNEAGFLSYLGKFDTVEEIPSKEYKRAIAALESKRGK